MLKLNRRDVLVGGTAAGVGMALGVGTPVSAKGRVALPIPPEIRADAGGNIELTSQQGTRRFVDSGLTDTFGVNGSFLGPTVRVSRGERVTMKVTNGLGEDTTMH